LRILHLISTLSGGGAERQLEYLAPELARLGHQVFVGAMRAGDVPWTGRLDGAQISIIDARSNYDPSIALRLIGLIRRARVDIVQTWILQMDILGSMAAAMTRTPWLLREPSSQQAYPPDWKSRSRLVAGRWADAIVSNSEGGDAYWAPRVAKSRRYVIPNAVPVEEIERLKPVNRTELGVPTEHRLVLYAGRLEASKNLLSLIAALPAVVSVAPAVLIICGVGPHRAALETEVENRGLGRLVRFLGHVEHSKLMSIMKTADVIAFLSSFEGFPNVVGEAMACGTPLVVSDIAAHRELLSANTAIFTNPDEPDQVAAAIVRCIAEGDATRRRADAAKSAARKWSIGEIARSYESVYRRVLRQRGVEMQESHVEA
jgi:glycosyltransferase involved in cell wall biosynthesis